MPDQVLFLESPSDSGRFDMTINGRAGEYDVLVSDFSDALRRRRVPADADVWMEYHTGRRTRLSRR